MRTRISKAGGADSSVGTEKSFAGQIPRRFPSIAKYSHLDCAGFVLTQQLDSASANFVDPFRFQSFAFWKIARGRNDGLGLHAIEERRRSRDSTVMLAFDQDVAL